MAGGGASGLEAARVLALRGHTVTIVEKNPRVGGAMVAAGIPPHKHMITKLVSWYEKTLADLGVTIKTNLPYVPDMAAEYDMVFSAVGAEYLRVIPGSDKPFVMTAVEALNNPDRVGDRVVVIGAGATGCETAEHFGAREYELDITHIKNFAGDLAYTVSRNEAVKNKDVTIVEFLPEIGVGIDDFPKRIMLETLKVNGVKTMANTKVWTIEYDCIRVVDKNSGNVVELPVDTVILAAGLCSNVIYSCVVGSDVCLAGDACQPGRIVHALFQSYCIARDI